MSNLFFTSSRNYMKRDISSGTAKMAAPSISAYGGNLNVTNLVIPHNLGFVPVFRAYYEPWGDGSVWPPLTSRINGFTRNPRGSNNFGPGLTAYADTTNLYLQLYYTTFKTALTGTFPVYWVIYRDYSLV